MSSGIVFSILHAIIGLAAYFPRPAHLPHYPPPTHDGGGGGNPVNTQLRVGFV